MIGIQRIYSLDEVDFDKMLLGSLPSIGNNLPFPEGTKTDKDKIAYIKMITNAYIEHNKDTLFMFKRVYNDKEISLSIGIRANDRFIYQFLYTNVMNNSRSWVHKLDVIGDQTRYLIENGFKGVTLITLKDSSTRRYGLEKYESRPDLFKLVDTIESDPTGTILDTFDFIGN